MNIRQVFGSLIVLGLVMLVFYGVATAAAADKPASANKILIIPLDYTEPDIEFNTYSIGQPEFVPSRHRANLPEARKSIPVVPKYNDERSDEYRHYMWHHYRGDYEWCDDDDEAYIDDHYDEEKYDCYFINSHGHRVYFDCGDCRHC